MSTKNLTKQSSDADKADVGNPHYEPKKGFTSAPSGGVESVTASLPKKRVTIPIRDKFTSELDLMNFTGVLGGLPDQAAKVTRFSASPSRLPSADKWTLLTDVSVETDEEYENVVKDAINRGSFKIRQPG